MEIAWASIFPEEIKLKLAHVPESSHSVNFISRLGYYWFCGTVNLTFCKLKEITLLIFLQRILSLKGPATTRASVTVQRDTFPNDILEKLVRGLTIYQKKRKSKIGNSQIVDLKKREKILAWIGRNSLHSAFHSPPVWPQPLDHWFTDKMVVVMN